MNRRNMFNRICGIGTFLLFKPDNLLAQNSNKASTICTSHDTKTNQFTYYVAKGTFNSEDGVLSNLASTLPFPNDTSSYPRHELFITPSKTDYAVNIARINNNYRKALYSDSSITISEYLSIDGATKIGSKRAFSTLFKLYFFTGDITFENISLDVKIGNNPKINYPANVINANYSNFRIAAANTTTQLLTVIFNNRDLKLKDLVNKVIIVSVKSGNTNLVTYEYLPVLDNKIYQNADNGLTTISGKDTKIGKLEESTYTTAVTRVMQNGVRCQTQSTCYLTTASVDNIGLSDDCFELQTLRNFRDNYMAKRSDLKPLVDEYYQIAPMIVRQINKRNDAHKIWLNTYFTGILPAVIFAKLRMNKIALGVYKNMTNKLLILSK